MDHIRRRLLRAAAGFGALATIPWPAGAQGAWPTRSIRVVVGFPAGGLTDILARAYCEPLAQKLGQPVVVENKPGAGSMIAAADVAKAAPDGYTFLFTISSTMNQNRILYKTMPYDPDKDFALERLHALWTLDGLDAIEKSLLTCKTSIEKNWVVLRRNSANWFTSTLQ